MTRSPPKRLHNEKLQNIRNVSEPKQCSLTSKYSTCIMLIVGKSGQYTIFHLHIEKWNIWIKATFFGAYPCVGTVACGDKRITFHSYQKHKHNRINGKALKSQPPKCKMHTGIKKSNVDQFTNTIRAGSLLNY